MNNRLPSQVLSRLVGRTNTTSAVSRRFVRCGLEMNRICPTRFCERPHGHRVRRREVSNAHMGIGSAAASARNAPSIGVSMLSSAKRLPAKGERIWCYRRALTRKSAIKASIILHLRNLILGFEAMAPLCTRNLRRSCHKLGESMWIRFSLLL